MTTKEIRELDAWIAEHVMGWKLIQTGICHRGEFYIARQSKIVIAIDDDFEPTTDPGAAMMVWQKCLDHPERLQIFTSKNPQGFYWVRTVANGKHREGEAPTLELAICLFAKRLFE